MVATLSRRPALMVVRRVISSGLSDTRPLSATCDVTSFWLLALRGTIAGLFFGVVIVAAVVLMPHGLTDMVTRIRRLGWRYFAENIRTNRL